MCHCFMRNYMFPKYHKFCVGTVKHRSASGEKVFSYAYTEKFGTSWDLNPHCSGGRSHHHITHINPFAKYPKFGGVTVSSRGGMTGKVLTRQLNGKTETGWDLNTRPCNTAKATLH